MIKGFRQFLLQQIDALEADQLNAIPDGFSNNIIWNLGHSIAAQQNMCYLKSGLPAVVGEEFLSVYMSGTRPEKPVNATEITFIKGLYISTIDQWQSDFGKGLFVNYSPSPAIARVYGFEVNNVDQAADYLLYHDGLHAGQILLLKRHC